MRMQVRKNRSEGSNLPGVYYAQTGAHFKERGWIARIEVQVEVMGMTLQQKDVVSYQPDVQYRQIWPRRSETTGGRRANPHGACG